MSGAGRKSAYRKSVTEDVLNSFPEPDAERGERIAQVVQSRGGNILQVRLDDGEESLAILPTKFRKLIWVKRGDYIIVQSASHDFFTAAGDKGKVKFMVEHILYRDQIKHLKEKGFWPELFADVKEAEAEPAEREGGGGSESGSVLPHRRKAEKEEGQGEEKQQVSSSGAAATSTGTTAADGEEGEDEDEDEYYESSEDDMSDLHVNTNRLAKMRLIHYEDSDDDDDDEEEES